MSNLLNHLPSSSTLAIAGLGPMELVVLGIVVLVLFGNRLPSAAKSLGQSFSAFKKGVKEGAEDDENSSVGRIERSSSRESETRTTEKVEQ